MKVRNKIELITLFILLFIMLLISSSVQAAETTTSKVSTTEEFIAAAQNEKIKIIDVTSDEINFMKDKGTIVLDVTGKTIDLNQHTITTDNMAFILQGNNFTIKNGTIDAKGQSYSLFIGDEEETNYATIENITGIGGFNIYNTNNVVIKNCNVTGKAFYAIWCDEGGKATIESGTYVSGNTAVFGIAAGVFDTRLEIKGGNYISNEKSLVLQGKDGYGNDYNCPIISGGIFDVAIDASYCENGYEPISMKNNQYSVCNHTSTERKNQKDASCTESGYTGDSYCMKCGKEVKKGIEISALGHIISDWNSDEEIHWKECMREGCSTIISETKSKHTIKDGKCEVCSRVIPLKIENVVDDKTNVKFEYTEGTLPKDIKLEVNKLSQSDIDSKIKTTLTDINKFEIFDINLLRDGEKIQPNGKVKVSLPITTGFDKSRLIVYRIEENNKIEYEVTVVTIDGKEFAQFETDHFSYYVLGETLKENNSSNSLDKGQILEDEPKTGIISGTIGTTVLLVLASIGYGVCKKKMYE